MRHSSRDSGKVVSRGLCSCGLWLRMTDNHFMHSNTIESLETRRLLSATISPPSFFVYPQTVTWPANHEFFPSVDSTNLPIQYSLLDAPKGMTITSQPNDYAAMLTWTPTEAQIGTYTVTVVGSNSAGTMKVPFSIQVTPDVPELSDQVGSTYQPIQSATVGVPSAVQVVDSSGEQSVFSVVSGPAGVSINPTTGLLKWTPTANEAGSTKIIVQGKNIFGTSDLTIAFPTYTAPAVTDLVVTTDGLNAPTMSWKQPTNSLEKITGYNIVLQAYGPNAETTFDFDRNSPATSFKLQGLPKGDYEFIATVTPLDSAGHVGLSTTGSQFEYAGGKPFITVSQSNIAVGGGFVSFKLSDSDTASAATFAEVSGPVVAEFDANAGAVSWYPTNVEVGKQTFVFSATDAWGTVTRSMQVIVQPPVPDTITVMWVSDMSNTGFTLNWQLPTDSQFIAGYTIYLAYGPGSTILAPAFNISAGVASYHFSNPNLGTFAARMSAFNSLGQESGVSQWVSEGNTIYNPTN